MACSCNINSGKQCTDQKGVKNFFKELKLELKWCLNDIWLHRVGILKDFGFIILMILFWG